MEQPTDEQALDGIVQASWLRTRSSNELRTFISSRHDRLSAVDIAAEL